MCERARNGRKKKKELMTRGRNEWMGCHHPAPGGPWPVLSPPLFFPTFSKRKKRIFRKTKKKANKFRIYNVRTLHHLNRDGWKGRRPQRLVLFKSLSALYLLLRCGRKGVELTETQCPNCCLRRRYVRVLHLFPFLLLLAPHRFGDQVALGFSHGITPLPSLPCVLVVWMSYAADRCARIDARPSTIIDRKRRKWNCDCVCVTRVPQSSTGCWATRRSVLSPRCVAGCLSCSSPYHPETDGDLRAPQVLCFVYNDWTQRNKVKRTFSDNRLFFFFFTCLCFYFKAPAGGDSSLFCQSFTFCPGKRDVAIY